MAASVEFAASVKRKCLAVRAPTTAGQISRRVDDSECQRRTPAKAQHRGNHGSTWAVDAQEGLR